MGFALAPGSEEHNAALKRMAELAQSGDGATGGMGVAEAEVAAAWVPYFKASGYERLVGYDGPMTAQEVELSYNAFREYYACLARARAAAPDEVITAILWYYRFLGRSACALPYVFHLPHCDV